MTVSTHTHDHVHTHDGVTHEHAHDEVVRRAPVLPPSTEGSVMLDIGGDIGALVVHTPDDMAGLEIEIARRGEDRQFVHTEVRARHVQDGCVYAGVFVAVPAGDYSLLGLDSRPFVDFSVAGGAITELHWPT